MHLSEVMEEADGAHLSNKKRYEPDQQRKESSDCNTAPITIGMEVQTFHGHLLFTPDLLNKDKESRIKCSVLFGRDV